MAKVTTNTRRLYLEPCLLWYMGMSINSHEMALKRAVLFFLYALIITGMIDQHAKVCILTHHAQNLFKQGFIFFCWTLGLLEFGTCITCLWFGNLQSVLSKFSLFTIHVGVCSFAHYFRVGCICGVAVDFCFKLKRHLNLTTVLCQTGFMLFYLLSEI